MAVTLKKTAINFGLSTRRKIMASGKDRAMTAIINASTVPRAAPLPNNASTTGTIPAALEYMGTPMSTAPGTDKLRFQATAAGTRDLLHICAVAARVDRQSSTHTEVTVHDTYGASPSSPAASASTAVVSIFHADSECDVRQGSTYRFVGHATRTLDGQKLPHGAPLPDNAVTFNAYWWKELAGPPSM